MVSSSRQRRMGAPGRPLVSETLLEHSAVQRSSPARTVPSRPAGIAPDQELHQFGWGGLKLNASAGVAVRFRPSSARSLPQADGSLPPVQLTAWALAMA